MKKWLFLALLPLLVSCQQQPALTENKPEDYTILPKPVSLTPKPGSFVIKKETTIALTVKTQRFEQVAGYLSEMIKPATGFELVIDNKDPGTNTIAISLDESKTNPEGYKLVITPERIDIKASEAAGAFYAVQTLRQLLPEAIERTTVATGIEWSAPCVEIEDYPRFGYRGMHLDVCRHFFPVEFVKRYIDLLAMHKMNRFHWHLTEDQGWRIEIKKYPKLQEVAAWRKETIIGHNSEEPQRFDGQRYGGYYTQDEVKQVIRYAQSRFIEIVPEIEMPGHAQAALAAYPELACKPSPYEVATKWGVFEDVFCPTPQTFEFLENVLTEVIALFPGKYIHIGGDECPKKSWEESAFCQDLMKKEGLKDEHELQSYFIRRMEKFINSKGKKIIGWDEILEGGLAPDATVMSWRGTEGGIAAAKQRHDVIMTPTTYCYLDYYQSKDQKNEPLGIGGYLPLDSVYSFNPTPAVLNAEEAKHILGAQGNVWTEYIKTPEHLEYMAYPRAIAIAEMTWTPQEMRQFPDFQNRLTCHAARLDELKVNYAKHYIKK
ncbi:MAG: beta-N-acetylhexosaminidase [Saprospiraceae bacterium]|nr:beta-N-acetylhexosaminidase [Saprospiraceae bacterium]